MDTHILARLQALGFHPKGKKSHSITNQVHAGMISHPILLWFWDGDSVRNPWPALHSEQDLEDFVNNDLAPPFQADVTQ